MIGDTTSSTSKNDSRACSSGLYGWYAVCTSKHLRSDKIYFLSLFNEPLALYRDKGNKAVCIKDYCPHRGASFRGGEVKRNEIICPYHGARFSSNQTCSKHPKLNCQHIIDLRYNNYARNIYLLQYPCVEKDDYIYIYYTGKSKSNLEEFEIKNPLDVLLPESRGFKSLDYCYEEAFLDFKCDWDRIVENHLDVLHIFWMHGNSLPGNTVGRHSMQAFDQEIDIKGNSVRATYFHSNSSKDEFISQIFIPPGRIIMFKGKLSSARYVQILDHIPMGKNRARVIVRHYRKFFKNKLLCKLFLFKELQHRTFYNIFSEDYLVLMTQTFSKQMGYIQDKYIRLLGEDRMIKLFWDWHDVALDKDKPWDIHPAALNMNVIHRDSLMVYPPENKRLIRRNHRIIFFRTLVRILGASILCLTIYLLLG